MALVTASKKMVNLANMNSTVILLIFVLEEYKIMAHRLLKAPKEKFQIPQTSAQEYGWDSTPLVSDFGVIDKMYLFISTRWNLSWTEDFTIHEWPVKWLDLPVTTGNWCLDLAVQRRRNHHLKSSQYVLYTRNKDSVTGTHAQWWFSAAQYILKHQCIDEPIRCGWPATDESPHSHRLVPSFFS